MNYQLFQSATQLSLDALFDRQVSLNGQKPAISSQRLSLTYEQLNIRACRMAEILQRIGVKHNERICVLSENDPDFLVICIAALRIGATVATLNPRLSTSELEHCVQLVTPQVLLFSQQQFSRFSGKLKFTAPVMLFGEATALDHELTASTAKGDFIEPVEKTSEDIQFIIYTSGTTGLPKAAMISQRAMLARLMVYVLDYGVNGEDTFLAWSPLCHMASIELGFGTLLLGGKVVILQGPDLPAICDYLETDKLSNLIFFPGMVEQAISYLHKRRPSVRSLKKFGALADLFNPTDIEQLTRLLNTPFTNTFGSTETGMPPLSAGRLEIGKVPSDFGKVPSSLCDIRIFGDDAETCDTGEVGELVMRGPTLFSGYWADPEATAEVFRDGWFHSGDMFCRRVDGKYDYVDRRKYLIKSGGENIYPAEIERVILQHPGISDAVVVRRSDRRWGEVPVLVAVARGQIPPTEELLELCEQNLASFKRPKDFFFMQEDLLPRSSTGKIVRSEVESWVSQQSINATQVE